MNIEIANRLQKLRKEKGFSQEELADALGISRQAVSKWERAEASPDTDNLICLAKLYNVSLDSLLDTDETIEELKEEQKEKTEEKNFEEEVKKEKVEEDGDTFLRDDEGNFVHIGKDGVHIKADDGSEVHIGKHGFKTVDKNGHVHVKTHKFRVSGYVCGILMLFAVIAYLLIGFLVGYWEVAWTLFLVPVIIASIIRCFEKKKLGAFNMPVLCTVVFITVSMLTGLWHPMWVVFLLVPVYYTIVGPIDRGFRKDCCCKDDDDDKDEDDD